MEGKSTKLSIIGYCIMLLLSTISILMIAVSLNSKVTWSEYNHTYIYDNYNKTGYYICNLWKSIDAAEIEGDKKGNEKYIQILQQFRKEDWKTGIRLKLNISMVLVSCLLILLVINTVLHCITPKKPFYKTVVDILALGSGIAAVCVSMIACTNYKKGLGSNISSLAKRFYYKPEYEEHIIGYSLAYYSSIPIYAVFGFVLLTCAIRLKLYCLMKQTRKQSNVTEVSLKKQEITTIESQTRTGKVETVPIKPNGRPIYVREACFHEKPNFENSKEQISLGNNDDLVKVKKAKLRQVNRRISLINETIIVTEMAQSERGELN